MEGTASQARGGEGWRAGKEVSEEGPLVNELHVSGRGESEQRSQLGNFQVRGSKPDLENAHGDVIGGIPHTLLRKAVRKPCAILQGERRSVVSHTSHWSLGHGGT